jgi:hypothetical protein
VSERETLNAWRRNSPRGKLNLRVQAVTRSRLVAWVRENHPDVAAKIHDEVWDEHGGRQQRPSAPGSVSGYVPQRSKEES